MGYASVNMPLFNSVNISGYHMQEARADADLELSFTITDRQEYARTAVEVSDLKVNNVAPRLSFLWGIRIIFITNIAKMRAGRRMWEKLMKELYQPKNSKPLLLRAHCQTSVYSLTGYQPPNNVVRTTVEVLAIVMEGTQSLHTNLYDEAVVLSTPRSSRVARYTQLTLRKETGMTEVSDPWGGLYMTESLMDDLYNIAMYILREVEEEGGGMMRYIEYGRAKMKIEESATKKQGSIDLGRDLVVGVNKDWLDEDNGDNSNGNGDRNEGGEDALDNLSINNAAMRESQI